MKVSEYTHGAVAGVSGCLFGAALAGDALLLGLAILAFSLTFAIAVPSR